MTHTKKNGKLSSFVAKRTEIHKKERNVNMKSGQKTQLGIGAPLQIKNKRTASVFIERIIPKY